MSILLDFEIQTKNFVRAEDLLDKLKSEAEMGHCFGMPQCTILSETISDIELKQI